MKRRDSWNARYCMNPFACDPAPSFAHLASFPVVLAGAAMFLYPAHIEI